MYSRPRIIPCLSIINQGLVKTVKFKNPRYLGDPINAVKIFNGKGVDELSILDIVATKENREPDFDYLKDIASEAFMPLSYGGGVTRLDQIKELFHIGYEKVIINSAFVHDPALVKYSVEYAGSQSIVVSIDAKKSKFGKYYCYIEDGNTKIKKNPVQMAKDAEDCGAGEVLLNSIDHDGMMNGFDIDLIQQVCQSVSIPVIACGGAKGTMDLKNALLKGEAHAVAAGSMFVYYGEQRAVLISFPDEYELKKLKIYNT